MHGAGRSSLAPHGALNLQGPTARRGGAGTWRASATERTTSPPPARYCAGDGDAVKTDSQARTPKSVARAPRRFKAPPAVEPRRQGVVRRQVQLRAVQAIAEDRRGLA